jgi:hypothetical protein
LNKLDPDDLLRVKKMMDVDFEKNRIAPEDPNYQHDVRKDFNPTQKSGWDSDSD